MTASMSGSSVQIGIKPFDGIGFSNWEFRISLLLEQNSVLHVLTEDPPVAAEELAIFKKHDVKARNIIVQCIADNILTMIKDKRTAKEIMETLRATYERKGMKSLVNAQKKWRKMEYRSDKPLQDFFQEFEVVCSEVKTAGGKMDDAEVVNQLLVAMPSDFDGVVSAMDIMFNKDKSAVTLEYVKNTLLAEEERMQKKTESTSAHHHAFTSFKGKKNLKYNNFGFRGQSYKRQYQNSVTRFSGKCFLCNLRGHKRVDCPKLKNSVNVTEPDTENELAFIVTSEEMSNQVEPVEIMFVLDSGATGHLLKSEYKQHLTDVEEINVNVNVAKLGASVKAVQQGTLRMITEHGTQISIQNVMVCEDLAYNLLSVQKLETKGYSVIFENGSVRITKNGKLCLNGQLCGRLYILKLYTCFECASIAKSDSDLWHRRMGHSAKYPTTKFCETCLQGKQARLPYMKNIPTDRKATRILQTVSTDVCGKITPPTHDGKNYFVSFIDHFSHFSVIFLLQNKSEVIEKFKLFVKMVETKFDKKIENLRCDQGGEYIAADFKNFCENEGISVQYTMARNPSQNGVAERFNRTVLEKARCILFEAQMKKEMWGEAVATAVYLVNRTETSCLRKGVTPAEVWYGYKPDLNKIKVFGCPAYVFVHKEDRNGKLDSRSRKMFMVGYCSNGYRLWEPESRKIVVARNVIFNEVWRATLSSQPAAGDMKVHYPIEAHNPKEDQPVCHDDSVQEQEVENRHSSRVRKTPRYLEDFETDILLALSANSVSDVPESYDDAIVNEEWRVAIKEELSSLESNGTWQLIDRSPESVVIDSRWIFTEKNLNGVPQKKARLVARGYQQPAMFEEEIYAPVARMPTLRVLLALTVEKDLHLQQLDVKSAFLKSPLKDEVLMEPPEGLQCNSTLKVCRLVKALYGLRQSPKCWNEYINSELVKLNFKRSNVDPCLYFNGVTYILIWVDDFLMASESKTDLENVKCKLMSLMDVRDLSSNDKLQFLGLDIYKSEGKIVLSQKGLIQKVLRKFNMINCKPMKIPLPPKISLFKADEQNLNFKVPYKELIGSLMYLMLGSRPDLCFSVSYFGRFQNCYSVSHWKHLKNVLRYIKYTESFGLNFIKTNTELIINAYVDSDFASDINDRKSVSGYVIKLNNNVIVWSSKKQSVVALSSCESEFYALSSCLTECIFLKNLLCEICSLKGCINVYEDNQSTIKIAQTHETKRSKHIDVKYHFVRDLVISGQVKLMFISTNDQLADVMTKALCLNKFAYFVNNLGITNV